MMMMMVIMTGCNSSTRKNRSAGTSFSSCPAFVALLASILIGSLKFNYGYGKTIHVDIGGLRIQLDYSETRQFNNGCRKTIILGMIDQDVSTATSKCPPPVIPLNAIVTTRWDGNVVQFQCKAGYTLIGTATAMCVNDAWNHPPPTCHLASRPHRHTSGSVIKNTGQRQQQSSLSQYSILRSLSDLQYQHDYNMPTANKWGAPRLSGNSNRPLFSWDLAGGAQYSQGTGTNSGIVKPYMDSVSTTPYERYSPTSVQISTESAATSSMPANLYYKDRTKQSFMPPETRSALARRKGNIPRKRRTKGRNSAAHTMSSSKEAVTDSYYNKKQKNSSSGGRADKNLDGSPMFTSSIHSADYSHSLNKSPVPNEKVIVSHQKRGDKVKNMANLNPSPSNLTHRKTNLTSNDQPATITLGDSSSRTVSQNDPTLKDIAVFQNSKSTNNLQLSEEVTSPEKLPKLSNSTVNDYYMAVNFSEINLSQLDMSCMKNDSNEIDNGIFLPAPEIAHGSVDIYRRRHNSEEPFNSYLEAFYVCEDGYHFEMSMAHSLYCLKERWIGPLPNCIPVKSKSRDKDFDNDDEDPKMGTKPSCTISKGGCEHICEEQNNKIICSCYRGYYLKDDKKGCIDINECEVDNGGCQHQCWNIPGSFLCYCPEGYGLGSNRKSCMDKNECLLNNGHGPCQDVCTNIEGGYHCACSIQGTQLSADNHTCEDINECATNNFGCSHSCLNTVGSAFCTCDEGYMLGDDWKTCEDIDECQFPELAQSCRGDCINTIGSYKCGRQVDEDEGYVQTAITTPEYDQNGKTEILCDPGYIKDDSEECIDVDECALDNFGCSHICENTPGSASCACPPGYNLLEDWKTCEDVDECTNGDLTCSHGCSNVNGSAHCTCPTGYQLLDDERTCEDLDECSINKGGCTQDCINTPGSYRCACSGLYQLQPDGTTCRVAFCVTPSIPHKGELICNTSPDRGGFYIIHTSCKIRCPPDMQLTGIETITCAEDGQWDSYDYNCSALQLCPPLERPANGDVMPDSCLTHSKEEGEYCYFSCHKGYSLTGSPQRTCKRNRWEPAETPQCIQDVEEPRIICPPSVTVDLSPNQKRAFVQIQKPHSNVDVQHVRVYPSWISNFEAHFPPGTFLVTYQAIQPITNRTASCSFSVTVQDRQPPIVFNCPQPITDIVIIGEKRSATVTWKEPIFKDNVGITYVWKSKEPGSNLPPGVHHIRYIARDAAGNTAHCGFTFRVTKRMQNDQTPSSFSSRNAPAFLLQVGKTHGCKQMNKLQNELLQVFHSALKSGCPLEQHSFFAALKRGMLPPTAQLSVHSVPRYSKPLVSVQTIKSYKHYNKQSISNEITSKQGSGQASQIYKSHVLNPSRPNH